jgi:hypothetical protein
MTGVVVAGGGDRWWAWAASRLTPVGPPEDEPTGDKADAPVVPATIHIESSGPANTLVQAGQVFGGVHVHQSRRPPPEDSVWLRSCWEPVSTAGAAIDLRYLADNGGLEAFLVMRAEAPDRAEAHRRVTTLRDELGALPSHVAATPVIDEALTRRVLEPFRPADDGIVEIGKRLTVQRANRSDAHRPWLTAVTPLTYARTPWDSVWTALRRLGCQAVLSVGLAPYRVGPGLRAHLNARAADLERLARPGPPPTAVWRVPRPPDEFAAAAHPLSRDAVRRYTDRTFLARVTIAAQRPIPGVLAELVADTISAPSGNGGFAGAAPAVMRPSLSEAPVAWANVTTLNFAPLSAHYQGHPAEAVGELERVLTAIVDLEEAAALFRLPYRAEGGAW